MTPHPSRRQARAGSRTNYPAWQPGKRAFPARTAPHRPVPPSTAQYRTSSPVVELTSSPLSLCQSPVTPDRVKLA